MKKDENKKLSLEEEKAMIKRLREYHALPVVEYKQLVAKNIIGLNYPIPPRESVIVEFMKHYSDAVETICKEITFAIKDGVEKNEFLVSYLMPKDLMNDFVYDRVCVLLKQAGYVIETYTTSHEDLFIRIYLGLSQDMVPYEKVNFY